MSTDLPSDGYPPPPELWQFVPLAAYTRPEQAAGIAAWASFKQLFRNTHHKNAKPVKHEDELRCLPEIQLAHLVGPIDWRWASDALDAALNTQAKNTAPSVQFLIGQPHNGHPDIVTDWAARHEAQIIQPPSCEQRLANHGEWCIDWPADGQAWALPCLERFFLRNAEGMASIRNLLEVLLNRCTGPGLVGCDSWAWAFFQRISSLPLPQALTLQAFDGPRLSRLFAQLVNSDKRQELHFRHARNGHDMLTVPCTADTASTEVIRLAAHCRGNVGTARHYWRQRLRALPDSTAELGETASETPENPEPNIEMIWVSATQPELTLPIEANEDVALVLHALLLHNGLSEAALTEVLPLARHQCIGIVLRLQRLSLLELNETRWHVTALAYELVRNWLYGRGFLIDDF